MKAEACTELTEVPYLPVWFEDARTPIFKFFTPDLDVSKWRLIIAKIEVEFLAELYYQQPVEIRTYIAKLGNSSMTVEQQAWQNGVMAARGSAIMIHFDHQAKKSLAIPDDIRAQLTEHLIEQ